jgi:hypothetical protein
MRIHPPSILLVACSPSILERCRMAASVMGVHAMATQVSDARRHALLRRPFAVVAQVHQAPADLHALRALARDMGATLMEVDADVCEREIEAMLAGALDVALRRGKRIGAGRYSIIGKGQVEVMPVPRAPTPGATSETPPPPSGTRARDGGEVRRRGDERGGAPITSPGFRVRPRESSAR